MEYEIEYSDGEAEEAEEADDQNEEGEEDNSFNELLEAYRQATMEIEKPRKIDTGTSMDDLDAPNDDAGDEFEKAIEASRIARNFAYDHPSTLVAKSNTQTKVMEEDLTQLRRLKQVRRFENVLGCVPTLVIFTN